ncbi:alpha-glucosidase [Spiroplasma helicoides]|uniref:Alpha-glucosidase n=1 Tax=Spiroplasma helicoides TaxID=216938 RepID=A0A1B3SLS0_9MOLU|nr:alpha-glucosidase [Spiroplasma helicoides]AOG60881.1 alpha-glucosidase [Spiroplasma helicoides]
MKKWWMNEIVYQIYPKSFKDSNNDGIGDINGITEKLDYLKDLGITMIWICPIFKSPMADNGYDISDFKDIDPQFGSMQDFEKLLRESKKVGIKILLDLVVNHTSDEHEWFKKALEDKNSKYKNYYIFKKGIDGQPPNNWRSIFGGSVWEKVDDEYYFHAFHKKQPDLNWENKEMREEIYAMINWWLEKGIAGFRIDSITFIKKDQDYSSLPSDGADGLVTCKHKTRNRPGIEHFLLELKEKTFAKYDALTVGEAPGVDYNDFTKYIGEDGYFSMIFDFKYADIDVESGTDWFKRTNWKVSDFKNKLFKSQEEIQKIGWSANFLENHDQPRVLSKLIKEPEFQNETAAKALAILLMTLRGVPFIYQGQELGMKNFVRNNIREFDDISSIDNYYRSIKEGFTEQEALNFINLRSRDNTRTPMLWNLEKGFGFSEAKPWIEYSNHNDGICSINNNVYDFYKKLISLKKESEYSELITFGKFSSIEIDKEAIICFSREYNNKKLLVFINLGAQEVNIEAPTKIKNVILNNYEDIKILDKKITMKPYQGIIVEVSNDKS